MLSLRYTLLLLFITIDDCKCISADVVDLLPLHEKNAILKMIDQEYNSENWFKEKNNNIDQFCHLNHQINNDHKKTSPNNSKDELINDTGCHQENTNPMDFPLEQTIDKLNKNLQIGEKVEFNTASLSITLEKVSPNNITNKQLSQPNGIKIRFPSLNINKSIIINLITFPSLSILSLTIHDQYGKIMDIKNTTKPFEIHIPQKKNIFIPSIVYANKNFLSNESELKYYYINLTHSLNLSISLHIDIQPKNSNHSFLLIIRFSGKPDLKTNLFDDSKILCPKDRKTNSSKYTYSIDNTRISDHQWAILGIKEMNECTTNNIQHSSDYSIQMYTSACYYLDSNKNWQSDGLIVGSETNENFTQCLSTHLTTFAGGFVVLPEPIDWNSLQFDPIRNLTIYITLILILLLYCGTMGYSHHKDKIDATKLMVIPMADNNARDTYLYQLVVFTGMRTNAGTTSKVHFILSGNDDETSVRTFSGDRRILNRGNIDSFVMAVPRPLGQLSYLRIWHDNSGFGSDASWFLKYVLVRDLQTMETSYFICEKWLAVEKDSGEIDRTIAVASELDKAELKHVLSKNAYRSMADNHLWFSIFAYHLPSATRFTRVQRCTCCFVLLCISLLMNIMYYGWQKDLSESEFDQYGVVIGPFRISKEELSVGVTVELIIFFPSILLVALFRRSKPRHPRMISPVAEAIANIRSKHSNTKTSIHLSEKKENKFLLPWWCLIIAYILSFLMGAVSVAFILIRGVQIGDARTRQWLGSILTSFCASVLLTQPLKVLTLALLFMCLCRTKRNQVDVFVDDEDPIEDFTVSRNDPHRKFPPKSLLAKTRLDPYRAKREKATLKKLRDIRFKEIEAWLILRELFFLLLFLGILYGISFANRDVESAHQMVKYLRREFLKTDHLYEYKYKETKYTDTFEFENIGSIDDYWNWLENVFIDRYSKTKWEDTVPNITDVNRTNKMIGWPTLRQLRVSNETCPRKALRGQMDIDNCNLPYTWYNEDKNPFGPYVSGDTTKSTEAFRYTPSSDNTLIYSTSSATYMAGGYIHRFLGPNSAVMKKGVQNLKNHNWIDRYTRAVFLTFGLYNANANLFVYCSLLLEQLPITNNLILRASFQPFKLVQLYTGADLIYCLIYLILIIYYMYSEIKLFVQMRKAYFKQFWSYINWAIIFCSWFGVVIHVLRQTELKKMSNSLKGHKRNPVNLQLFSYLDSVLTYLLGFCCFFGTLKILRLLRFNRRMSLLHLTLEKSYRQILGFLLMFSIVFFAFTALFYLLFHLHSKEYSTLADTSLTCFEMISLRFSTVKDLKKIDPLLAGLCLFLFIFLAVFLLSNMFISIIVDNFNLIRQDLLKEGNQIELLDITIHKIKQWFGMRGRKGGLEQKKNPVTEFPEKMDKLLTAIDKLYKDSKH